MKKFIAMLICLGFLTTSVSAITPLRVWECRPSNPNTSCSKEEKESAARWFKNAKTGALITLGAALALVGITATAYQLQAEKDKALKSKGRPVDWDMVANKEAQAKKGLKDVSEEPEVVLSDTRLDAANQLRSEIDKIDRQLKDIDTKLATPRLNYDDRQRLRTEQDRLKSLKIKAQNNWLQYQQSH